MNIGLRTIPTLAACLLILAGCEEAAPPEANAVEGGDSRRGREAIVRYGCGSCHAIPGVALANGTVGPPLDALARQSYVAGIRANTSINLVRWIVDPTALSPRTAMPDLRVSEDEARDIAAYLYEVSR